MNELKLVVSAISGALTMIGTTLHNYAIKGRITSWTKLPVYPYRPLSSIMIGVGIVIFTAVVVLPYLWKKLWKYSIRKYGVSA